jgi:hypothetical protein
LLKVDITVRWAYIVGTKKDLFDHRTKQATQKAEIFVAMVFSPLLQGIARITEFCAIGEKEKAIKMKE